MNYMKQFEDFQYPIWQSHVEKGVYHYYFNLDRNWFHLTFMQSKPMPGVWLREYAEETDRTENIFIGKNATRIFPILKDITEDFIKQEYPDMIVIPHLSMSNEEGKILNTLNKRARYNYQELKKIQGYHLQYYNSYFEYYPGMETYYGKTRTTTTAFLLKNGTSKSPEDWFNQPNFGSSYGEEKWFVVNSF